GRVPRWTDDCSSHWPRRVILPARQTAAMTAAPRISAVVIARDEALMLPGCLRRLGFADDVVVAVDDRTTDTTESIARAAGATVVVAPFTTFAEFRNHAVEAATG